MRTFADLADACVWTSLGLPLHGLALALDLAARREPLLARALAQKDCVYRLQNHDGSRAWHIVIEEGHAKARRRAPFAPASTLTFRRNQALLALRPEGLLSSMIDNDVIQSGSTYELYRLGFLFDLLRRAVVRSARAVPGVGAS